MRILIANPFGIGDVLFSLPLVRTLRELYPTGFLGYLCNRRTQELVESWPFLDWVLIFEKDELRAMWRRSKKEATQKLWDLVKTVQRQRFDLLIDLSLSWQYGLAALLAGVPKRVGFDFKARGRFLNIRLPIQGFHSQPVSEYYLDLLSLIGLPKPQKRFFRLDLPSWVAPQVESFLSFQEVKDQEPLVGMVPGGGASWGPWASFKRWPSRCFSELGNSLIMRYGVKILLIGGHEETSLCEAVAKGLNSPPVKAIQVPSILLLAGLLKRCDLVVGNDSGPMHLAALMGTKTVTIFGPVDGSVYRPLANDGLDVSHRVVAKGLACRPCYRGFRFPPCPWENACLRRLSVEEVMESVDSLMVSS